MKKHIIIAGASKSGKTTLSLKLAKKGFVHYKMDSIKRGIDNNFCEAIRDVTWRQSSPKMAHLIGTMIRDNETDSVKDKEFYLIDTCHLFPKDIVKENLENTVIIFIGYTELNPEKKLKYMRSHDKSNLWTSKASDERNIYNLELGIPYSKAVKEECEEVGIKYFDTSKNFKKNINEAYKYILNEMKD